MRVTIHQPEHMPWLGFFHKVTMADVFVILDNVQFRKDYFQNRNQIRTAYGKTWITVPVKNKMAMIDKLKISYEHKWVSRYLNLIKENYSKSQFYSKYMDELIQKFNSNFDCLCDLNIEIIIFLLESLGIQTKILRASELNLPYCEDGTAINLNICKSVGADVYISGISGKEYLDESSFKTNNIKIEYQEFHHPIYKQQLEPFIPCMSTIDLLFNYGDNSLNVINGISVDVMEKVFL